ncbi:FecR family protein [Larkinella punicea]|uniref:FecR family protein n=1 Tax=Larkinella punicea TaxID=2315727 RepID=A0A368JUX4_9BACT|nr:FecR family protein [Larkinella punicea]RCR71457.1 FecR family protein [Larkinella punicea]
MESSLIKKIVFDYFDHKCTSIQRKLIEEWLADKNNLDLFHQYLDEWESQHPQYNFDPDRGLEKVYRSIQAPETGQKISVVQAKPFRLNSLFKWLSVASIVLVLGWIGWTKYAKSPAITYRTLINTVKEGTGEIYEKENLTNGPILVNLPDKSSVILQPQSRISYSPKLFNNRKREIVLVGEAFFEVQKNPEKPFFVYTRGLITKVLGTSFLVKTQAEFSEVVVKTGKVEVFLHSDKNKEKKMTSNQLEGLVLKEDERINTDPNQHSLNKPLTVDKTNLKLPIQSLSFNFDETAAITVIETLNKAYHANIVYDSTRLSSCKLTAHLSDEPLLQKIELICIALEASYVENDGRILIKSNGCK